MILPELCQVKLRLLHGSIIAIQGEIKGYLQGLADANGMTGDVEFNSDTMEMKVKEPPKEVKPSGNP